MVESGLLAKWKDEFQPSLKHCLEPSGYKQQIEEMRRPVGIKLTNMKGAFVVLFVGFIGPSFVYKIYSQLNTKGYKVCTLKKCSKGGGTARVETISGPSLDHETKDASRVFKPLPTVRSSDSTPFSCPVSSLAPQVPFLLLLLLYSQYTYSNSTSSIISLSSSRPSFLMMTR